MSYDYALARLWEMTREVMNMYAEHWYVVAGIGGFVVGGPLAVVKFLFPLLSPEKQYRLRLRFGLVAPKYSLAVRKPMVGIPVKLVSYLNIAQHCKFLPVRLVHEGDKPEYDIKLELREPTNRWTFRPYEGIGAVTDWNHEKKPSDNSPRCAFIDLNKRGHGIEIGAICINQEKEEGPDEYLKWKFTCLGVTVGEGKSKID